MKSLVIDVPSGVLFGTNIAFCIRIHTHYFKMLQGHIVSIACSSLVLDSNLIAILKFQRGILCRFLMSYQNRIVSCNLKLRCS